MHRIRRTSTTLLVVLAVFLCANPLTSTPAHSQQPIALADVCADISQLAAASSYHVGVVVQDLASGERCDVNSNEEFRSASLYKLVILANAYQQIEDGTFSLDEYILIEPHHYIDDLPASRKLEIISRNSAESVRRMIQMSSNSDSLALRERLGVSTVDGTPSSIGMESTRLGTEFITTPDDITTYFEQLYQDELVSPEASAAMLQVLLGQKINDLIPRALPAGIPVAHKTGLLSGHLNDAGIVYAAGGDYVLTILVEHSSSISNATTLIHQITRLAHQTFASIAEPLLNGSLVDSETSPAVAPTVLAEPLLSASLVDSETSPAVVPTVLAGMEAGRRAIAEEAGSPNPRENPASTGQRPADNSEFTLPFLAGLTLRETVFSSILFGILVTTLGAFSYPLVLRRLKPQTYNRGAVNAVTGGGQGIANMSLGSNTTEDKEATMVNSYLPKDGTAAIPASPSLTEVVAPPVIPSPRLERLKHFFGEQQHLLEDIQREHEQEMHPFELLLEHQSQTQQQLLVNLEIELQPLREYTDSEEANLDALETSMSPHGNNATEHLTSEYLETQRHRISETRDQIDGQRLPLLRYGEEQRDSVEIALARFDDDIATLESNLVEQRKILMRMMTDMRSESFGAIQGFLEARATAIAELAAAGITDYGKLAAASQTLHDASDPMVSQSVHNQAVLESTAGADATLLEALHSLMVFDSRATLSRTAQSSSGPRSLLEPAPSADAPTELEADEQTEETIGDSGATLSPTAGSSFGTRSLPEPAPSADALTELEADEQTEETIGQIG